VHTGCWWGNLKERDHLEDLSLDGGLYFNEFSRNRIGRAWIGLMWLTIRRVGGLF
jgi:hypothetical protein